MQNEAGFAVQNLSTDEHDDGYVDMHEWMHKLADEFGPDAVSYFIGGESGAIKIGWSGNPQLRLKALRREHRRPDLEILAMRTGGSYREAAYHNQFYHHRLHGEWFDRHPDILAEIDRLNLLRPDRRPAIEPRHQTVGGSNGL